MKKHPSTVQAEEERRERFLNCADDLYALGCNDSDIARVMGVSRSLVSGIMIGYRPVTENVLYQIIDARNEKLDEVEEIVKRLRENDA